MGKMAYEVYLEKNYKDLDYYVVIASDKLEVYKTVMEREDMNSVNRVYIQKPNRIKSLNEIN